MESLNADEEALVVALKIPTLQQALDAQVTLDGDMLLEDGIAAYPKVAIQVEIDHSSHAMA